MILAQRVFIYKMYNFVLLCVTLAIVFVIAYFLNSCNICQKRTLFIHLKMWRGGHVNPSIHQISQYKDIIY